MKKRIENTAGGPTSPARQNVPGAFYCTESGFTPDYSTVDPGDTGSANTGTRLVAAIANIPAGVTSLTVPNSVMSSAGGLVLRRVNPPFGSDLAGGTLARAAGTASVAVNPSTRKAMILYEVLAAAPYAGANGCFVLDQFTIGAHAVPSMPLAGVTIQGLMAPLDATQSASGPAPEPRFQR